MLFGAVPLVILSLAGGAFIAQRKREAMRNPSPQAKAERRMVYETALNTPQMEPAKLRTLAKAFREVGSTAEATMLEKRAALREAPEDLKKERRETYKKAMASTDPQAVDRVAAAFEEIGATGAASELRKYSDGLRAALRSAENDPNQ